MFSAPTPGQWGNLPQRIGVDTEKHVWNHQKEARTFAWPCLLIQCGFSVCKCHARNIWEWLIFKWIVLVTLGQSSAQPRVYFSQMRLWCIIQLNQLPVMWLIGDPVCFQRPTYENQDFYIHSYLELYLGRQLKHKHPKHLLLLDYFHMLESNMIENWWHPLRSQKDNEKMKITSPTTPFTLKSEGFPIYKLHWYDHI